MLKLLRPKKQKTNQRKTKRKPEKKFNLKRSVTDNILSVTERLRLKRFEETSDKSSMSSKKSKSSKSKTKSADITSFMEKASKPKEDTVSSSTKAKVKKLMSPSKRVSFPHEWKSLKLHERINRFT